MHYIDAIEVNKNFSKFTMHSLDKVLELRKVEGLHENGAKPQIGEGR